MEKDAGHKILKETLDDAIAAGVCRSGDTSCEEEAEQAPRSRPQLRRSSHIMGANDYEISGNLSAEWSTDNALHPAWGWTVAVFSDDAYLGVPTSVGEAIVDSDGSFVVNINGAATGFRGKRFFFVYWVSNPYLTIHDRNERNYGFTDFMWENIPHQLDVGLRTIRQADIPPGVPEVMNAATALWSKLDEVGIDPIRHPVLTAYYPNTWYTCGGGQVWSCASLGGKLWLLPQHGTDPMVVAHELGHQLNFELWDNKLPANASGAHNVNSCYPGRLGMVLMEGFANFIAAWVSAGDNRAFANNINYAGDVWRYDIDFESRVVPPNCADGYTNESWIARAFWDLYDKNKDGDDLKYYVREGAVLAIYLAHPPANDGAPMDMRNFEAFYKNSVAQQHRDWIEKVFNQNKM